MNRKHTIVLVALFAALLLLQGGGAASAQGDMSGRTFPQTGFTVDNDAIWNYFQARGGVDTFGYPVSRTFLFRGLPVQIFQRHILQVTGTTVRPVNLLDPDWLPLTRYNGSSFPAHDPAVASAAPLPSAPNYGTAVRNYLVATVPNTWEGAPVAFFNYYITAAPAGAGLNILLALEVWGFPTSQPMRDPTNHNFIYQRFQRGIMHYDASTGFTRGILLGDAFKQVMSGANLPSDLASDMANSPFLRLYAPGQPKWLARSVDNINPPINTTNTDLTNAFETGTGGAPTVDRVQIFLIALDDGGQSGPLIGCNDSVVGVTRQIAPTTTPLAAAIRELLSIEGQFYGESGFYNALYQSDLELESLSLEGGVATIRLTGDFLIGGVCDEPRVAAQLQHTALQFDSVNDVVIYINGELYE